MSSQNEHAPPKAKRKRTESHASRKEGEKSSQQKQNDEYFYQPLHEYNRIDVATIEASDLLRAFRQWPDHLQLSIPMHVSSAIHQLSTSNEPDLVKLVDRYWQASFMTSARPVLLTLDSTDTSRPGKCISRTYSSLSAQIVCQKLRREVTTPNCKSGAAVSMMVSDVSRSMLRTTRAIRTWLMLKHDTAAQLGEPRMKLERALAKHLLDCSFLFLLRCKLMVAY